LPWNCLKRVAKYTAGGLSPPETALAFDDVRKAFASGVPVLDGLTARISGQGITFVVGASGSGKSVLCRLAVGLLEPDGGQISLLGEPVAKRGSRALVRLRRRAPYLVQGPALLDWLSVEQNVALACPGRDSQVAARRALDRVGLLAHAAAAPLSLGPATRKRVALARALALDPEFLLLDEPTTGLDRAAARQVNDALAALSSQGMGALVVSHDFHALRTIAHHVLWVDRGRAGFFGSADDFLSCRLPEARALIEPGLREASFDG
jgi:phospholipid/cholesterol/gamma-HCH transport system ATP-binding protein